MLSRFERDALSKPGVRWILLLTGSNDISAALNAWIRTSGAFDAVVDHPNDAGYKAMAAAIDLQVLRDKEIS